MSQAVRPTSKKKGAAPDSYTACLIGWDAKYLVLRPIRDRA